jgi:sugar porter (SP) family MFS transporter
MGALLGTMGTFIVATWLGRRRELMLGAALYGCGSIVTVSGMGGSGAQTACVIAGRMLYGLGIGLSMHAAPTYISEVTPSRVRGLFVSLKEGFIVIGIMLGFGAAVVFTAANAWMKIWLVPLPIAAVVFVGMATLPPSPRWLLQRAQRDAIEQAVASGATGVGPISTTRAMAALSRFRSRSPREEIQGEIASIVEVLQEEGGRLATWSTLCSARRALWAGLGLVLLQQITGQPSVLYYQNDILNQVGFGQHTAAASLLVSAAKLLATLFTVLKVDSYGRWPLLTVGISMMLGALLVLGLGFQLAHPGSTHGSIQLSGAWPAAVLAALVMYVMGYQLGFGPITWLMISEVFPLHSRTRALSLATVVNFGFNLLTTITLAPMMAAFDSVQPGRGASFLFFLYGGFCAVSLAFVQYYVPETKGKTLEEIERALR